MFLGALFPGRAFLRSAPPSEQSSLQARSSWSCLPHPNSSLFRTHAPQDRQRPAGLPSAWPGFPQPAPQSRGAGAAAPACSGPKTESPMYQLHLRLRRPLPQRWGSGSRATRRALLPEASCPAPQVPPGSAPPPEAPPRRALAPLLGLRLARFPSRLSVLRADCERVREAT